MTAFPFDNSYARLPEHFYARVAPTKVGAPKVIKVNRALCELLGLDAALVERLEGELGAQLLSGNTPPEGATTIALAYAGHQFGHFVPRLGDGRAILLGEIVGRDGKRRDVQLKGSGRTPFSRGGDGRAALGPVLREYVVSEAMAALGIPTTRALAAVTTGEPVFRDSPLPGAILTRVAASHIRVGTFEYFAGKGDVEAIKTLATYALQRHYAHVDSGNDGLALLENVIVAQANLVARWLGVGFVHGVMNTDNTAISGETIDYGPCAFLDEYVPNKVYSSIDHHGRYAFANQPRIAQWNLVRFAEALLPAISDDEEEAVRLATARLEGYVAIFEAAHARVLRAKLGLAVDAGDAATPGTSDEARAKADRADRALAADLLERLAVNGVDYTLFFRRLSHAVADPARDAEVAALFENAGAYLDWAEKWRARLAEDGPAGPTLEARSLAMKAVNPAFIPRNHRIEEAIAAAVERDDFAPFETLVRVLAKPYVEQADAAHLAEPPPRERPAYKTFCGT